MQKDFPIDDLTDSAFFHTWEGELLTKRLSAICNSLEARIEGLASRYASSNIAYTERGIPFTAYVNGRVRSEGEISPWVVVSGDMGADAQVAALQKCAGEHFDVILANKPVDCDLLIWRCRPEIGRALHPDGLHLRIYSRLAWDHFRG